MTDQDPVLEALQAACTEGSITWQVGLANELFVQIPSDQLRYVVKTLTQRHDLQHLSAITALQVPGGVEVMYHFWRGSGLTLCVHCPPETGVLPSIVDLVPVADWYEREVHDLFGIRFSGHPDLKLLLLPDDWSGPPPFARREEAT